MAPALLAICFAAQASPKNPAAFPLYFEPNVGQAPPSVAFIAHSPNYTAFLAPAGATLQASKSVLHLLFIGVNPNAEASGQDSLDSRIHYLLGGAEAWHTEIPTYGRLEYHDLYPGVDLVYFGDASGRLEYTFVLRPGAEPSRIQVRFEGAESIETDADGDVVLRTAGGEWRHSRPLIYQTRNGTRHNLAGRLRMQGPDHAGFDIQDYDRSLPLLIDPVLTFSTYLGGSGNSDPTSIALDVAGNVYLAGWTSTLDFPEGPGPRLGVPAGVDVYIAKLGPTGRLLYITYLGGTGDDRAYGIAVDSSGSAVVTGWTYSANFPVWNAAQSHWGGDRDAFIAKLNPAGNALVFSTYLGGSGADAGNAVALDQQGNIYVAGETTSSNFPSRSGFQVQTGGRQDAFFARLTGAGALLYSSYLGGNGDDRATAIAVDSWGNAYLTGSTFSSNFPVANAFQPALGGGQDAFAAKIGAPGNTLLYSTYLGGSGGTTGVPETGNGIAVDSSGCAYVAGATSSANFPTVNPFQMYLSGSQDAFILKLSAAGNALVYSTYLGGSSIDLATAIAVDSAGRASVAGYTASTDFPVLHALQPSNAGGYDVFLTKLTPAGNALEMSTYFGGMGSDSASGIALDAAGSIFVAAQTSSFNFPTANALQPFAPATLSSAVFKIAQTSSSASFLKVDSSTHGNWKTAYGADGFVIASDAGRYPVYAQVTVASQFAGAWSLSNGDVRALQKAAAADHISSFWGAWSSLTIDINLTDGAAHQVALYCLDWDSTIRSERIDVLDAATGTQLDSRTVSGFNAGQYAVWNLAGHITFRITYLGGANAVVSGVFFGGALPGTVSFVRQDLTTQGTWRGVYGSDGFAIANNASAYPAYAQVDITSQFAGAWTSSTGDVRALQTSAASNRIGSFWGAWSVLTIDINLTDGAAHQIALYCLDWDSTSRSQKIDVLDAATGVLLDSRTISWFTGGQYVVWSIAGHVTFRITCLGGANAVVSGILFGGAPPASATFLKQDLTTQGTWKGTYGHDGFAIPGDVTTYPAYAQVSIVNQFTFIWSPFTGEARALQKAAVSDRIASLWGAWSSFTIDLNLTDGALHQIAVYCLDWDSTLRSERIDVLDAATGALLDSRIISAFTTGQYVVWNVYGHVTFRITWLGGANAVVSGLFFH